MLAGAEVGGAAVTGAEGGGTGVGFTGAAVGVTGEEFTGVGVMAPGTDTIDHIAGFTAADFRPMAMATGLPVATATATAVPVMATGTVRRS